MAGLLKSLPPRATRQSDAAVLSRAAATRTVGPSVKGPAGGKGLFSSISSIVSLVEAKLGKYVDLYTLLRTEEEVRDYFARMKEIGIGSIDTETSSLDPITCTLAGVCLYAPGLKPAYIPLNHVSHITGARLNNQVDSDVVKECLENCPDMKWIMHGAKFDTRVVWHQLKVRIIPYWCTYLAARCLNNAEPSNELKELHIKYCESNDDAAWTFSKLFEGVPATSIPINTFYLYAAGDPLKTFELYEYQSTQLNRRKAPGVYNVFMNLEMPLIPVVAAMEDTGICLDTTFAQELSVKYHKILEEQEARCLEILDGFRQQIDDYQLKNPGNCLSDPVNINSPKQLAILFYDILGYTSPDKKKPRGTGEEIMESFEGELPQAILDYRGTAKLLSTYIDKMPSILNASTGKIHCNFNQYGADTGRFSSNEPNMQNIPSKNKEIRKMFTARPGYVMISCDFSQQEPRTLAHFSQDKEMIKAYAEGKDIYAWIASFIYNVPYEECQEHRADGTVNPEGKKRRTSVKSIILGIMYGRQTKSIADQLGVSTKAAQEIIDKFFKAFPTVRTWMDDLVALAKQTGYVETGWGRRRYLPDILLKEYEFKYADGRISENFDPLDFDSEESDPMDVPEATQIYFTKKLKKAFRYSEKNAIFKEAEAKGIKIRDNTMRLADAERQIVNTKIQGTSADMTKESMIAVGNDPELQRLGCQMIIQVHDELIAECPEENKDAVAERMSLMMIQAAAKKISVPMKCDAEITYVWYGEEVV